MSESLTMIIVASFGLVALGMAVFAALKGWQGWLDLKRLELTGAHAGQIRSPAIDRIEVADLRERIRKLESIASCIDL